MSLLSALTQNRRGYRDPFAPPQQDDYATDVQRDIENLAFRLQSVGVQPPETQNRGGALNAIMQALNAPGALVRAGVLEAVDDSPGASLARMLERAWGKQDEVSGNAILQALNLQPESKVGQFAAGLGVDILTDPLTYLTGGITRPLKFAGTTLSAQGAVQPLLRGTEAGLRGTGALGAALGNTGVLAARRGGAQAGKVATVIPPTIGRTQLDEMARTAGFVDGAELRNAVRDVEQLAARSASPEGLSFAERNRMLDMADRFNALPEEVLRTLRVGGSMPASPTARAVAEPLATAVNQQAPRALTRQETFGLGLGTALRESPTATGFIKAIMPDVLRDPGFSQALRALRIGTTREQTRALKELERISRDLNPEQQRLVTDLVENTFTRAQHGVETLPSVVERHPEMRRLLEDTPIQTLPSEVFRAFEHVSTTLEHYGNERLRRGLLSSLLVNYFPHKMTPEELVKLKNLSPEVAGKIFTTTDLSLTQQSAKMRQYREPIKTLAERAARGKAVPRFEHEFVRPFAKEVVESIRSVRTFDFFEDIAKQFGIKTEHFAQRLGLRAAQELPEEIGGYRLVDFAQFLTRGKKSQAFGKLGRVYLPTNVADDLTAIHRSYFSDEGTQTFVKLWDGLTNLWRPLVTLLKPSFHINNAVGNTWNAFLGGLHNPDRYYHAARALTNADGALKIGDQMVPYQMVRQLAEQAGVLDGGMVAAELAPNALVKVQSRLKVPEPVARMWGGLIRGGGTLGNIVESESRLALFIDQLIKRGGIDADNINEAAQHVNKYLFDYRHGLSPFESNVVRRLVPFYSFTRFNLPLQVAELINQPGKFLLYQKTKDNLAQLEPPPDAVPPWLEEALRLPVNLPNGRTLYVNPRLPLQQLSMLPGGGESASGEFLGMLHPLPKTIIELLSGQDFFTGRSLSQYQGQTVPATGFLSPIAQIAPGLVGSDVPGRVSPEARHVFGQLGAISQSGQAITSALAEDAEAEDVLRAVRLVWPGLYTFDPKTVKVQNLIEERKRLQDMIRKQRTEHGINVPTVSELRQQRPLSP